MIEFEGLYRIFLFVGVLTVGGAVFFFFYGKYDEIETRIREGMADYAAELYDYFDRMYKRQPMNYCYLMILFSSIGIGFVGFVMGLSISPFTGVVGMLLAGYLGFKLPRIVMRWLFYRRVAKFDLQLVDALNMMSNAIKSGLSFMQVIQVLEQEMPDPLSKEFGMVLKENRVGVNLNDALMNMTTRVPSEDLFMIVNSVVTLSQQGGDLSEAFETIANTIRERQRVSEKVRTMAQAGMTQATILSCFPLAFLGVMYMVQPDFVMLLFTTPLGQGFILAMILLIALGAFWMKKILTIDI